MAGTAHSIARLIDHSLLHPTLTDEALRAGCDLAKKYQVASVCIKPYAVPLAQEVLKESEVAVGTVVGFPHGGNRIETKVKEAEMACDDGATELDMVLNIGKVLSQDWNYVAAEIRELSAVARRRQAILKVIFENDFLTHDEYKVELCRLCNSFPVDFVKTSTGFGFVKQPEGLYAYAGATDHDLELMRRECSPRIQIKAAGGVRTLDDVLKVVKLGVTRVGATATEAILTEAIRRGYA